MLKQFFAVFLTLTLTLTLLPAVPGVAREGGYGGGGYGGGESAGLSSALTKRVAKTIKSAGRECNRLKKVYRYDCYRWGYKRAADLLVGRPAYIEAYKALAAVEDLLEREVGRNLDPTTPPLQRGFSTYKAVTPQAAPKIKAKAIVALDEAETVLLRAPEDKSLHYAKIAEAVNSNKVLLRSALMLIPGIGPVLVLLA